MADAALTLAKQFPHWKQPLAAAEFASHLGDGVGRREPQVMEVTFGEVRHG